MLESWFGLKGPQKLPQRVQVMPRGVVDAPSLDVCKARLDGAWSSLGGVPAPGRGVGPDDPQRSLPTQTLLQ